MTSRYGILVNPRSGPHRERTRQRLVEQAAAVLGRDCRMVGWDTACREALADAARRLSREVDVLVIAGGDGTIAQVINAMDRPVPVGLLPIGSANALACALGLPKNPATAARRIATGRPHAIDLIACDDPDGRTPCRAVMTGVGIEAEILRRRDKWLGRGLGRAAPYFLATAEAMLRYRRADMQLTVDGQRMDVPRAISVVVTKIPSYGFGLKLVPQARVDDGLLHVLTGNMGTLPFGAALLQAFVRPNRAGQYLAGREVTVRYSEPRWLETDGELCRLDTEFRFQVLPGALTVVC